MVNGRRALAAGNWKMNGLRADGLSLVQELHEWAGGVGTPGADMVVCPPATLVGEVATALSGSWIGVGGQDCHPDETGAHTGDVSAEMLADAGAGFVILGHSERRTDHGETDGSVLAKAGAARRGGLTSIICIGESEGERDSGATLDVLSRQIAGSVPSGATAADTVVAYEPVWAIGTGRTPTVEQVDEAHRHIRGRLEALVGAEAAGIRVLYGGSVKPGNAVEILAPEDVDGALVGGASLKAGDFRAIWEALAG